MAGDQDAEDSAHVTATDLTADKLNDLKPPGWSVRKRDPITTEDSEPEPDVVLARGTRRDFDTPQSGRGGRGIGGRGRRLVIGTRPDDKEARVRPRRLPAYWIVNLVDRSVEVFTDPTGPARDPDFRTSAVRSESESIHLVVDGRDLGPIAVRDLLPS